MSDIGLHGGLYGEIRELAELVDLVIADLAAGAPRTAIRRKLADRLGDITRSGSRGLAIRYLGSASAQQNLAELADALQNDLAPPWINDRLEGLARLLDTRRSAALERVHGVGSR
jgi:hypothetical protein